MASGLPTQKVLEMESQTTLSLSALPISIGDNQSESQPALGEKGKNIPFLKKQPIIPLSAGMEDGKTTTLRPVRLTFASDADEFEFAFASDAGFTPCNNSSSDVECSEPSLETLAQAQIIMRDFMATTKRFIDYIWDAPSRTVRLDDAAEYLGVDKDYMYKVRNILEPCLVQLRPDVITWIEDEPTLEVIKIQRNLKLLNNFEKVVRSLSDKTNGKNRKWRWLFLTEADIKDFVVYQNDIFMTVKCPCDINFKVPRPAQDADVRQRRYGIICRCSQVEGMKRYIVSKLESYDVVNGYKTSRSYEGSSEAGLPKEEEGCKRVRSEAGLPKVEEGCKRVRSEAGLPKVEEGCKRGSSEAGLPKEEEDCKRSRINADDECSNA